VLVLKIAFFYTPLRAQAPDIALVSGGRESVNQTLRPEFLSSEVGKSGS
jgi:hypothetical protein